MSLFVESSSVYTISHYQLRRLVQIDAIACYCHLVAQNSTPSLSFTNNSPFKEVLGKYYKVFETPTSLQPKRDIQHRIHLVKGTPPINVKPYRCPHF